MKKITLPLLLLSSSLALAAIDAPYEPEAAWSKNSIRVCFGVHEHQHLTLLDPQERTIAPFREQEKLAIKSIITKEFNKKDLGLEFVGWEDCDQNITNTDLIILKDHFIKETDGESFTMRGGAATLGENGQLRATWDHKNKIRYVHITRAASSLLPAVIINTSVANQKQVSASQYLQLVALHEFGHVAGLRHEHVRLSDAKNDPNCQRVSTIPLREEAIYHSTKFTGPYDHNSIMNYCYFNTILEVTGLNFRTKKLDTNIKLTDPSIYEVKEVKTILGQKKLEVDVRIGLSAQDKEAVKCMYVYNEEIKKNKCSK